ncbi:heavy metal translocating P-type ATPase [Paenibacillus senegalensis]|uniref:heavy metal translocating P-type ATPase n=1 Tax=Paenibacillus senegalensis TaxID=1465766 RepID=UPI000287AA3E|nr:heavy metal translocating P-type ATPase [Paenibacillus senegalensis]
MQPTVHSAKHETSSSVESTRTLSIRSLKSLLIRHAEGAAALASGLLMLTAWAAGSFSEPTSIALYLLAYAVGGYYKAREGLETLIKDKDLDVNLLMIVAAIGAASIGYWAEGAILIFIFSLSGALENYTMDKSRKEISALMDLKPETAWLVKNGEEVSVSIEQLNVGDLVLVKPGERIPADGIITSGNSAVNQASITGESVPVDKAAGDEVFAGTLNGQGALFVEVSQPSSSSLFAKIIKLVQEAQSEKPATQVFMDKFERIYARVIILVTLLLIALPTFWFQWTWEETFYKAMVFLVVASPCALVASIMPAMLSAVSNSARKGVLFKGGAHLENISRVKAVAFDKTGTLTHGRPVVKKLAVFQGMSEEELLEKAASVESLSEHPLAQAVVGRAKEQGISLGRPQELKAWTGFGVEARYAGETWKIGKPSWMDPALLSEDIQHTIRTWEEEGNTVIVVQNSEGIAGLLAIRDSIREESKAAIARLKQLGITAVMLTGDQQRTAQAIADEAGIDHVYAELLPEEKVARIEQLKQTYGHVAMVGDGVNDAPALATATVGIAMGAKGSDAALETADIVLMNDDLDKLAHSVELGRRTRRIVTQNMVFALSVITLLIFSNFTAGVALPLGVIGHEGSTILVILNGLRLLR